MDKETGNPEMVTLTQEHLDRFWGQFNTGYSKNCRFCPVGTPTRFCGACGGELCTRCSGKIKQIDENKKEKP